MTTEQFTTATTDSIESVYSGKDGKCCCGCAGTHRYNSKHARHDHERDSINDKQVAKVLRVVQDGVALGETTVEDTHAWRVVGTRLYIAYYANVADWAR